MPIKVPLKITKDLLNPAYKYADTMTKIIGQSIHAVKAAGGRVVDIDMFSGPSTEDPLGYFITIVFGIKLPFKCASAEFVFSYVSFMNNSYPLITFNPRGVPAQ